jgi:hypothetical protein
MIAPPELWAHLWLRRIRRLTDYTGWHRSITLRSGAIALKPAGGVRWPTLQVSTPMLLGAWGGHKSIGI